MGLLIYTGADPTKALSNDGTFSSPLLQAVDGSIGGIVDRRLYVRNDASDRYYTSITVQPTYLSGTNVVDGTSGYYWKVIAGDTQPLEEQWSLVGYANSISIPDIGSALGGNISTYEPFWLRIVVPRGAPVGSHSGIRLRIGYTETLVP